MVCVFQVAKRGKMGEMVEWKGGEGKQDSWTVPPPSWNCFSRLVSQVALFAPSLVSALVKRKKNKNRYQKKKKKGMKVGAIFQFLPPTLSGISSSPFPEHRLPFLTSPPLLGSMPAFPTPVRDSLCSNPSPLQPLVLTWLKQTWDNTQQAFFMLRSKGKWLQFALQQDPH